MRKFFLFLLILTLALWCGGCVRHPAVTEVTPPEEEVDCNVTHLLGEMARTEIELNRGTGDRAGGLTRLSRLAFLLGELSSRNSEKSYYFEKGQRSAQMLVMEYPSLPEGHYWLGMNLCGLAEQGGARRGLKMVPEIVAEMEKVLKTDPAYDQAGPHRVLGRIYFECPQWPLSVGSISESYKHLVQAVSIAPENSTNQLFLAETLLKMGKKEEACKHLEEVLNNTRHSLCRQFLEEDRQAAQRLLQKRGK
jgi:tetratricopeptide (TPR) repeat protein|uniref:Tetratricopeptide repeat protein n=1 Tax=Desulfobacca acetoxidans TaxID=60893 RepID=A0A7C3UXX5_9BACT